MATTTRKVTMATVKAFIRKNRASLHVRHDSRFDGMDDCVRGISDSQFVPAVDSTAPDNVRLDLGIKGLHAVYGSRNYVSPFNRDGWTGYEVSNSCGSWIVAVAA